MNPIIVDMETVPLVSASTADLEDRTVQIHAVTTQMQSRDALMLYSLRSLHP